MAPTYILLLWHSGFASFEVHFKIQQIIYRTYFLNYATHLRVIFDSLYVIAGNSVPVGVLIQLFFCHILCLLFFCSLA